MLDGESTVDLVSVRSVKSETYAVRRRPRLIRRADLSAAWPCFAPKGPKSIAQGRGNGSAASIAAALGMGLMKGPALKGRNKRSFPSCFALSGRVSAGARDPGRRSAAGAASLCPGLLSCWPFGPQTPVLGHCLAGPSGRRCDKRAHHGCGHLAPREQAATRPPTAKNIPKVMPPDKKAKTICRNPLECCDLSSVSFLSANERKNCQVKDLRRETVPQYATTA